MSETMIERVANAVFGTLWPTQKWEGREDVCRAVCAAVAHSAIEAMKNPTYEMRKVCSFTIAEVEYPAMIDAALKEPTK